MLAHALGLACAAAVATSAHAAYVLEIDTDGADDGVLTFNAGFSFGGDTTQASQSAAASAFGTTGGDSIFGGDGVTLGDTYVYNYAPDSQPDNLVIPNAQPLGEGNLGTGVVGGGAGTYRVYALWPYTENTSGGPIRYTVSTAGDSFFVDIDQNSRGDAWVHLGDIGYTSGAITVTQVSSLNTFVSMRAAGMLFEAVPAPGAAATFAGAGLLGLRRRRRD